VAAAAAIAALVAGAVTWRRSTGRSVDRLLEEAGARTGAVQAEVAGEPGDLPPPVARYFAYALARWLGEAVWFPTALVPGRAPGEGVQWAAMDDSIARATITDGGTTVSAEFHFAATGEITGMTAMRYRDVNGAGVLTPFEGRYRDYTRRDGVMVPMSAEVAWLLPEGRFAYWRGRPEQVEYDRATTSDAMPES
jgi:hypothetical protein